MAISLDSISRVKRNQKPPIVIFYGEEKIGKTTLAASAFEPIFLPLEDGLSGIGEVDAFPQPTCFQDVVDAMQALLNDHHHYKTFVVDSLDWLEPLIWKEVTRKHNCNEIEDLGYGRGYAECGTYWREFLDLCRQLRDKKNMAIIMIAHAQIKRFDSPDHDGFNLWELKLHKIPCGLCFEMADIIGFCQQEVSLKKAGEHFGQEKKRSTTSGRRFIHVGKNPAYRSGNRYGLPDKIPMNWQSLVEAIKATNQSEPAPQPLSKKAG